VAQALTSSLLADLISSILAAAQHSNYANQATSQNGFVLNFLYHRSVNSVMLGSVELSTNGTAEHRAVSSSDSQDSIFTNMDFKSVLDFFQGSIFSEEYLGNFTIIHQQLQSWELEVTEGRANPEQIAWVRFLRSVFWMLIGNLTKAFNSLREISLIQDLPPKWLLRAATYETFYHSLRQFPAVIRFKPLWIGPTAAFRGPELGFRELFDRFEKTQRTYLDNSDLPLFRFESQLLPFIAIASLPLWNDAFIQHPSYPRGPWEARRATAVKQIAERATKFRAYRDTAVNRGMYQLGQYLTRLEVEIEFGKSPKPSQTVENIKSRYRTFVDKHNLAIIKMLEADYILSPPFSNPVALNLLLTEGIEPGFSIGPYDSVEGGLKLGDIQAAGQLYQQAYDLFTDSASPRGRAAVLLRQGCVEHLQASANDVSPEEKSQRCETARQKFAEALHLFELDEAHSQIVRGHQILLNITSGSDDNNIVLEAAQIGYWGRASSNELVSQFVGILMQRFGRRQMLDYARNDVALKCYKCAQSCFRSLEDRFGLFRALNSEMYILNSMNNQLAALSMVNSQKALFKELLEYIDKMANEHPSIKSSCPSLSQDMIAVFGNFINSVYFKVGDTKALDAWKKDFRDDFDKRGGVAAIDEGLDQYAKYLFRDRDSSEDALSILPRLPHFLVGDGVSHKWTFSDHWQRGQDLVEKYLKASSDAGDALEKLDIDGAERRLRDYISEAAPNNIASHPEDFLPVRAAAQLGDFDTASKILRGMVNPNLWSHDVNPFSALEWRQAQSQEERLQESMGLGIVLAACTAAQDWTLGRRVLRRIEKLFPKYLELGAVDSPGRERWQLLGYAGVIYEHSSEPLKAFVTLLQAFLLAEQSRNFTSDANSRRGIFSDIAFGEIFTGLARLCLRAGDLGVPLAVLDAYSHNHPHAKSWREHALLFLEQAKARNLLEALMAPPLDTTDPNARAIRARKRRLRMALLALNERTPAQEAELAILEANLKDYEDELDLFNAVLPTTSSTINDEGLYGVIGEDEIVIEVDFSKHGSTLFGITSNGIEFAQQRRKLHLEIRRPVLRALKHIADYPNSDSNYKTSKARVDLEVFLKEISDELILPLAHLIRRKSHVIFVASQPLTAFPFSALLIDDEPLFLHAAVSQVPSLGTLLHLWKSRQTPDCTTERFDSPVSVCTIAKAVRLGGREKLLFLAAIEAMIIARTFNTWPVEGSKISRDTFKSLIQEGDLDGTSKSNARSRILHIGAHGHYDPLSPWLSYISLMDQFRVLDIAQPGLRRHRKIALIVFAACLSGMGQGTVGNDVLGFAQAVLETGCAAYLGALWNVDDQASMLLMTIFYQLLWDNVAGTSTSPAQIAKVWREAQKKLYHLNIESSRELIRKLAQVLDDAAREGYEPKAFVMDWKARLDKVLQNIEKGKLDLKHPFYWGPFVVVGYGGLAL
jgi:CHAT domain-containing protein